MAEYGLRRRVFVRPDVRKTISHGCSPWPHRVGIRVAKTSHRNRPTSQEANPKNRPAASAVYINDLPLPSPAIAAGLGSGNCAAGGRLRGQPSTHALFHSALIETPRPGAARSSNFPPESSTLSLMPCSPTPLSIPLWDKTSWRSNPRPLSSMWKCIDAPSFPTKIFTRSA